MNSEHKLGHRHRLHECGNGHRFHTKTPEHKTRPAHLPEPLLKSGAPPGRKRRLGIKTSKQVKDQP